MADGFLGRWSQRKEAARAGRLVDTDDLRPVSAPPIPVPVVAAVPDAGAVSPTTPVPATTAPGDMAGAPEAPLPSMQDVAALRADSDFKPFLARAVAPEVRNAAMKKLFADPHFNVMDGLDTYIDDYSLPDPLPMAMLRKMASAQFLKLFDDEADKPVSGQGEAEAPPSGQEPTGKEPTGKEPPHTLAQSEPDPTGPARAQPHVTDMMDPDGTEPRT